MSKTLALVLAGGRGKRMEMLCQQKPKPALPFAGGYRVIDFVLGNIAASAVDQVAVLIDYQRECLKQYLGQGAGWGLSGPGRFNVWEPRMGGYRGTADAVNQNLSLIEATGADLVLVLAADHVYRMDYRDIIAFHEKARADVTVVAKRVSWEEASRFGILGVADDGRICDWAEKPQFPRSSLASMGVYVFSARALLERLSEDAADESSAHDFGMAVIPRMVSQDRAFACEFAGFWRDIGTVEAYFQANMDMLGQGGPRLLDSDSLLSGGNNGPGRAGLVRLDNGSLVARGCHIDGLVENSVLSTDVTVEAGAVVRGSVIMEGCVLRRGCAVDRCILGESVVVGESARVGFGALLGTGGAGITVVGQGARIPAYAIVGRDCRVYPGVGESAFGAGIVPPWTAVSRQGLCILGSSRQVQEKVLAVAGR